MSKSSKALEQLVKIAEKQQKIINKLAQELSAQQFQPQVSTKRPAEAILNALPANVRAGVEHLELHGSEVRLKVKPGANAQAVYNGVFKTVTQLQNQNVLQDSSYTITVLS